MRFVSQASWISLLFFQGSHKCWDELLLSQTPPEMKDMLPRGRKRVLSQGRLGQGLYWLFEVGESPPHAIAKVTVNSIDFRNPGPSESHSLVSKTPGIHCTSCREVSPTPTPIT